MLNSKTESEKLKETLLLICVLLERSYKFISLSSYDDLDEYLNFIKNIIDQINSKLDKIYEKHNTITKEFYSI